MPPLNPADRPIPSRRTAATEFGVPDRLFRDPTLSMSTRLVAVAICAAARGAAATDVANDRLGGVAQLGRRAVQVALDALERAGWVHRLYAGDDFTLEQLRWAGYRDPWEARGLPRPHRVLVLLWKLPAAAREPGSAPRCAPRDARPCAPRRPRRGGGDA